MSKKILKRIKSAFGAIEVILILSLVAIVSTVAFIAYDQFKKQPIIITETNEIYIKDNPDYLTLDTINSKLGENNENQFSSVHQMVSYLSKNGYNLNTLKPKDTNYEYVYLHKENQVALFDKTKIVYPVKYKELEINPNIWRFISSTPNSRGTFSYYLLDAYSGSISASGGIDVGSNEDITSITISNNNYKNALIVRTSTPSTFLNIDVSNCPVKHYGVLGMLSISNIPMDSYFEYGKTSYCKIQNGKITVKNEGFIDFVYVTRAAAALTEDGGHILKAYCVSTAEKEATKSGYNGRSELNGGNVYIEYVNPNTLEPITQEEIAELGNQTLDYNVENYSFEGVLVKGERDYQIYTLINFASLVEEGYDFYGETVMLLSDIDLSGVNWNPIDNFRGTFDGNYHTIKNLTISSSTSVGYLGLFGNVGYGMEVRNLYLNGINISAPANNSSVGGLIGAARNNVIIENCHIDSTSNFFGGYVGGLIGSVAYSTNSVTTLISNCSVSAKLNGNIVGGFIGKVTGTISNKVTGVFNTLIYNSSFKGAINANEGINKYAAGAIGSYTKGNRNTNLKFSNVDILTTNIKSSNNFVSSLVYECSMLYHIENLTLDNELVTSIEQICLGKQNGNVTIEFGGNIYTIQLSSERSKTYGFTEENGVLVIENSINSLNGKYEENTWYKVCNAYFDEEGVFNFKLDKDIVYYEFDPKSLVDKSQGQSQQKAYVAGHDDESDKDIYKFDMYRLVGLDVSDEDGWMCNLQLGEGEYYDDPTQYVDKNLYDITIKYISINGKPVEEPTSEVEEELMSEESQQEEDYQDEKIAIFIVSLKSSLEQEE